ncbi:hypothetical protein PCASD_19076 [Puccinia coronata f. sp. avenae]|uniref:Uncharacterized protein n=1 Tax=Puccinia coronata f. sp. avenae TaxID=200324 RepID=A0A2N5SY40_9BASI|nr:hypothetical protein PCASD_19076 [Puccinia coronata f. sp. avenae]
MANETCVDPSKLIDVLQAKDLRRKNWAKDGSALQSVSAAKTEQSNKGKSKPTNQTPCHCTFCDVNSRNLNR